ncbi:MAG: hypothetical protein ACE5D8_01220 [Fidelibacterota bacterium]
MKLFLTLFSVSVLVFSCTELNEEIIHPDTWADPEATISHMKKLSVVGLESCRPCHGEHLQGGSAGVSCFTSDCHLEDGLHQEEGWVFTVSGTSHPDAISQFGWEACGACHGATLQGGIAEVTCYQSGCHYLGAQSHTAGWTNPDSTYSHMASIGDFGIEKCQACHGSNYQGGITGISCYSCHEGGESGHPPVAIWVGTPVDSTATIEEQKQFHGTAYLLDQRCTNCHAYYHAKAETDTEQENTVGIYCTSCHTRSGEQGKITVSCPVCHNGIIAPS